MKICILSEYFYPDNTGGTGTVLSKLVRQLRDTYTDLEIDVITSKNLLRGDEPDLPVREDWDGINIVRLSTPQPRKNSVRRRLAANMLFTSAAFRRLLAARKSYDLLLVVTAPPTLPLAAYAYSRVTGTPYVYLVYDLFLDLALSMNMLDSRSKSVQHMKQVQKNWLCAASKVIVLGRCMRDVVAERYSVPPTRMEVVPIPGNLSLICPTDNKTRFRAENNLTGFVVLYAGNFARYQDFDTILTAAQLLQHREDITFVFVGNGVKRDHINQRITDENLTNVRLLDFVKEEDLSDMLASADVSLVTLEQGAAGLAVPSKFYNIMASARATVAITEPHSEVGLVVTETECGVQVTPQEPSLLAEVLVNLASSPEKVARMGAAARQECEEKYSLDRIAGQFNDIFRDVALPDQRKPGLKLWPSKRAFRMGKNAQEVLDPRN